MKKKKKKVAAVAATAGLALALAGPASADGNAAIKCGALSTPASIYKAFGLAGKDKVEGANPTDLVPFTPGDNLGQSLKASCTTPADND